MIIALVVCVQTRFISFDSLPRISVQLAAERIPSRILQKNSAGKNDFLEMDTSAFSGGAGLRDSADVWLERNWCQRALRMPR